MLWLAAASTMLSILAGALAVVYAYDASGPFAAPDFKAALERRPHRRWWRRGT
jgi:hypothetical protein